MTRRVHQAELLISASTIAMAGLFLWDARRYGASPFEPIGTGAIPAGVAAGAILLGVIMLISAWRGLAATRGQQASPELGRKVLATFLLTIAYTAVLASGQVRYAFVTVTFFLIGVLAIAEKPKPLLPWAVGIALVLGFGLDYVFRTVFVTNIP